MPSNTSKIWTKVVVPIESYQCDLTKFATTRQFGDLFSWAGVGALSTEELAKALRDQSSPPRRGMAFLVNHGEHAYHLVTNSQVLFGAPQDATDSPTTTPKRSWLLDYDEENRLGADSSALTPVRFLSLTIEPTKLHWFPVISYPDLNIAWSILTGKPSSARLCWPPDIYLLRPATLPRSRPPRAPKSLLLDW
jgi:hypothetical protein